MGATENNHPKIRDAVIGFMTEGDNHAAFMRYTGRSTTKYIQDTSMNASVTWATDIEIVATATLLQTSIYVCTTTSSTTEWQKHDPLFKVDGIEIFEKNIYLTNLNQHFKRVISCALI